MNKDMEYPDKAFPFITHRANRLSVEQRALDGYINATSLCKASDRLLGDYLRLSNTKEFLSELHSDMGIPISELVQVVKGGVPGLQGTWVHPQVAIHLGQWASPKFAVLVSRWVFDWINGTIPNSYELPYHIRRFVINRKRIPVTHFSMLNQVTFKLLGDLELKGYVVPNKMMPDISLGLMFSKWLRENGYEPESFPTYRHRFDDGKRSTVNARLYPNEMMTKFNLMLDEWVRDGRALKYFKKKDPNSVIPLQEVIAELPPPIKKLKKRRRINK